MHLFVLLLTVLIDSLGFGLVVPLLSPLVMDDGFGFMDSGSSLTARGWMYSFVVAGFCLGQFFGSPVLGAISDRIGRKKVLLRTLWLGAFGYFIGALSLYFHSLAGLILSRLLSGVAAGNFSIAQSYIADVSRPEQKAKNFGLLGMAWGVGFILGPFLGGKLADSSFVSWFSPRTPFWFACAICGLNATLVKIKLSETVVISNLKRKVTLFAGLIDVKKAFSLPNLKGIFTTMFIFCCGWGFFTMFIPVFLLEKLDFGVKQISEFYACVGLFVALSQGLLIRPFVKKFSPQLLLSLALLMLGCVLILTSYVTTSKQMFLVLPLLAFPESLIFPSAAALISNSSPNERQGEIFGLYNSLQWAAIGISPLFSGAFVAAYPTLPLTGAGFCMFLAFSVLILIRYLNQKKSVTDSPS